MSDLLAAPWFYWAVGLAIGLPFALVVLTEWQHALRRRGSLLLRPVTLLRNVLLEQDAGSGGLSNGARLNRHLVGLW